MSRVRVVVEVEAPREHVWNVIADPRNLPKWDRRVVSVKGVPEGGLRPGTRYVTEVALLAIHARMDAFVLDVRPPEYAEIELSGAPLRATVRTRLTELDPARTRLDQDVEYHVRGGTVGEVLGRGLRYLGAEAVLRRGVVAQKRQAEAAYRTGDAGW
ncbi:MAG: SRPBCC family protein [Actinobacteria bacterium]|nr:SRPBCC family protein [Actinomycetota bacterium]